MLAKYNIRKADAALATLKSNIMPKNPSDPYLTFSWGGNADSHLGIEAEDYAEVQLKYVPMLMMITPNSQSQFKYEKAQDVVIIKAIHLSPSLQQQGFLTKLVEHLLKIYKVVMLEAVSSDMLIPKLEKSEKWILQQSSAAGDNFGLNWARFATTTTIVDGDKAESFVLL